MQSVFLPPADELGRDGEIAPRSQIELGDDLGIRSVGIDADDVLLVVDKILVTGVEMWIDLAKFRGQDSANLRRDLRQMF